MLQGYSQVTGAFSAFAEKTEAEWPGVRTSRKFFDEGIYPSPPTNTNDYRECDRIQDFTNKSITIKF